MKGISGHTETLPATAGARRAPAQVGGVAVEVVRDGAVVDAPRGQRLYVVLRHVLADAHRTKDALAVVCAEELMSGPQGCMQFSICRPCAHGTERCF